MQKMTEEEMQVIIGRNVGMTNICLPNVLLKGEYRAEDLPEIEKLEKWKRPCRLYEADLIYISPADYVTEIEIKITIEDFRNDFKKKIFHSSPLVSRFYYAFPQELYKQHKAEINTAVKGIAGIVTVCSGMQTQFKIVAPKRKNAKKLTFNEKFNFMRIGCMKWFKDWRCMK